MDLYFQRHDGSAVTCDDFLSAMADANDADARDIFVQHDISCADLAGGVFGQLHRFMSVGL